MQWHCGCLVLHLSDDARPVPTLNRPQLSYDMQALSRTTRQPQMITAPALPPETLPVPAELHGAMLLTKSVSTPPPHAARRRLACTTPKSRPLPHVVANMSRASSFQTGAEAPHTRANDVKEHTWPTFRRRDSRKFKRYSSADSPILAFSGVWFAKLEAPKRSRALHP